MNQFQKQQPIDKIVYRTKLMKDTVRKLAWDSPRKNIVADDDMMIDERAGEV